MSMDLMALEHELMLLAQEADSIKKRLLSLMDIVQTERVKIAKDKMSIKSKIIG